MVRLASFRLRTVTEFTAFRPLENKTRLKDAPVRISRDAIGIHSEPNSPDKHVGSCRELVPVGNVREPVTVARNRTAATALTCELYHATLDCQWEPELDYGCCTKSSIAQQILSNAPHTCNDKQPNGGEQQPRAHEDHEYSLPHAAHGHPLAVDNQHPAKATALIRAITQAAACNSGLSPARSQGREAEHCGN